MKRIILIMIALAALIAALAAMAGCEDSSNKKATPVAVERRRTTRIKWTLATDNPHVFLLIGDIKRDGDIVEFWEKSLSCDERSLSSFISHEQIDCSRKRKRSETLTLEAAKASKEANPPTDHKSVWGDNKCESPLANCWHEVVPDSPGEEVMRAVCGSPTASDEEKP